VDQALFASLAAAVGPGRAFWKLRSLPVTVASPLTPSGDEQSDAALKQRKLEEDELRAHSIDHSYHEASMPEAVVYPSTTAQVAAVVALCHEHRIPVTGTHTHHRTRGTRRTTHRTRTTAHTHMVLQWRVRGRDSRPERCRSWAGW
jgi:hypothetical protein